MSDINGGQPVAEEDEEGLTVPAFDVFHNRKNRSRIRLPNDLTRDHAELADVIDAAAYGRDMAALISTHAVSVAARIHAQQLRETEVRLVNTMAIAITNYDRIRRARAWYRRLGRWIVRMPQRLQTTPGPESH